MDGCGDCTLCCSRANKIEGHGCACFSKSEIPINIKLFAINKVIYDLSLEKLEKNKDENEENKEENDIKNKNKKNWKGCFYRLLCAPLGDGKEGRSAAVRDCAKDLPSIFCFVFSFVSYDEKDDSMLMAGGVSNSPLSASLGLSTNGIHASNSKTLSKLTLKPVENDKLDTKLIADDDEVRLGEEGYTKKGHAFF